jgi:hypothetical protein
MAESSVVIRPLAEVLKTRRKPKKGPEASELFVVEVRPQGMAKEFFRLVQLLPGVMHEKSREARTRKLEQLVEVLSGETALSPARVEQALLHSRRRNEFLEQFETLTSAQVADLSGSTAKNQAAQASRWKAQGKVFSLTHAGQELYPAFQFTAEGLPRPVVAAVLKANPARGWQLVRWFVANNGWLPGAARPVDLLDTQPDAVVEAARQAAQSTVG